MLKKFKIFLIVGFSLIILNISLVNAWVVDMWKIGNGKAISDVSYAPVWTGDAIDKINAGWLSILHTAKVVLSWVMLIYIVYLGFMMVMAMWADDKLSTTKRQIYYVLISFLFINIPGQLYELFAWRVNEDLTSKVNYKDVTMSNTNGNIFVNFFSWENTVDNGIILFIKVIIIPLVILQFIMAWISLISSVGNEEKLKKARTRFLNGIYGLIFIGLIQSWIVVAYSWNIPKWQTLFAQMLNMALFFAWPTAIFFLILGWFHYITSAWDEAKTKKWIVIIKNTVVAVIILLASYAFLKDLADFTI